MNNLKEKYQHYYKDVRHLDYIDVYRVLELFGITDQLIGHAVKKLLLAGIRTGGKNIEKDINEAIDTLLRYREMKIEDENKVHGLPFDNVDELIEELNK